MGITTRFPKIPEDQITPLVAELLQLIELQREEMKETRKEFHLNRVTNLVYNQIDKFQDSINNFLAFLILPL